MRNRGEAGEVCEETPEGENQANGLVEQAGKTVREYVRVLRGQMEDKAGIEPRSDDVVVLWIVLYLHVSFIFFMLLKSVCNCVHDTSANPPASL